VEREYMLVREVAEYLRYRVETVRRFIGKGKLRAWRTPGGHMRVLREDVEAWLRPTDSKGR